MTFLGQFEDGLGRYFRRSAGVYALVVVVFLGGVIAGSLAVSALNGTQQTALVDYFEVFLRGLTRTADTVPPNEVTTGVLQAYLKTTGLLWILGVSVIGIPFVGLLLVIKGFALGFAASFLIQQMGARGVVFSLVAVLPQNLIAIPALLIIGASSISFSLSALGSRRRRRHFAWGREFLGYSLVVLIMTVLLLAASLIEGYLSPVLMRFVSRII